MDFAPYISVPNKKHASKVSVTIKTVKAKGPRPTMEDRCVVEFLPGSKIIIGIFDGHGGDAIAQMCIETAPKLMEELLQTNQDISQCIKLLYKQLDDQARDMGCPYVGTTAAIILITPDKVWFSNCGDAMIAMKVRNGDVKFMTQNHKVENEKERIKDLGGIVTYWDGCARIYGTLNIARSIGDHCLKTYVVSEPYVTTSTCIKSDIDWILVASDGLWDVFEPHEVDTSLQKSKNNLQQLVQEAFTRGSTDNVTAALAMFIPIR